MAVEFESELCSEVSKNDHTRFGRHLIGGWGVLDMSGFSVHAMEEVCEFGCGFVDERVVAGVDEDVGVGGVVGIEHCESVCCEWAKRGCDEQED